MEKTPLAAPLQKIKPTGVKSKLISQPMSTLKPQGKSVRDYADKKAKSPG